jgi:hypothetical protein
MAREVKDLASYSTRSRRANAKAIRAQYARFGRKFHRLPPPSVCGFGCLVKSSIDHDVTDN